VLPLTPAITQRATELMSTLTLSHGWQAGDALIASTTLEYQLPLFTGNAKHFAPIPGLEVQKFVLSPGVLSTPSSGPQLSHTLMISRRSCTTLEAAQDVAHDLTLPRGITVAHHAQEAAQSCG
jgi:hypothetical protein